MTVASAPKVRTNPMSGHGLMPTLRRLRRDWSAFVFLGPALVIFSLFTFFALIFAFYLTFHEWSIIQPDKPFVGLRNYEDMLHDKDFGRSIINTVYFTAGSIPMEMVIGLFVAVALNQAIKFRGLLRTMYYLPALTPFVVQAIVWKWLYNGDYGLFNHYLLKTHLIDEPLLWLSDKNLAMPAVILMTIWGGVGFSMVVYLAGLQSIPEELYEAATIDGAGTIAKFRYITVPMLAPSSLFLLVIGIIGSFQVFAQIFVMTSGGPVDRTTTMIYFIYNAAFKYFQMGYASTLAFGLFAMLFLVTLLQLRLYRRSEI